METEGFSYVFWFLVELLTYLVILMLSGSLAVYMHFRESLHSESKRPEVETREWQGEESDQHSSNQKYKLPHGLEPMIRKLICLIWRDFGNTWYSKLVPGDGKLPNLAKQHAELVISRLCNLLEDVQWLEFFVDDLPTLLTQHISDIQNARVINGEVKSNFRLHQCVDNKSDAIRYYNLVSRLICERVLPPDYDQLTKRVIMDILASQVLAPTIENITDPDNVNLTLCTYLENQENLTLKYRTKFTYAESFEDFVEIIVKCQDVQELIQIRYHIITEMLHSSTINNLKKPEHQETDNKQQNSDASLGSRQKPQTNKAELLKSRDLKRYANQLRLAKQKCEKRIAELGGSEYTSYINNDEQKSSNHRGQKVLSFDLIMRNLPVRAVLHAFLKDDDSESLLEYWVAVETLRSCDPADKYRLASEIFNQFIRSSVTLVKPGKPVLKAMESFLIGNANAQAFFDTQEKIHKLLEDRYYPQFLVSDRYHQFIMSWDGNSMDSNSYDDVPDDTDVFEDISISEVEASPLITHSEYISNKIQIVDDKIFNKTQALQVLSTSQSGGNFSKIISDLEEELNNLKFDRRSLEAHQEQVEAWWRNIGGWIAEVIKPEAIKENDGWKVYYPIVIRLQEQQTASPSMSNGWVISRTLHQFKQLRAQLVEMDEEVESLSLPLRMIPGKPSNEWLEKSKTTLNKFIESVFKTEKLYYSAPLFNFISTFSPVKVEQKQKLRFKVSDVFTRKRSTDQTDDLIFFNQDDKDINSEINTRDSIAQNLYIMITEIFELKGLTKPLRRTLIQIVQLTSGKSINRQLRNLVSWLISKTMCNYYLKLFLEFFWPNGHWISEAPPVRTDEMKSQTRMKAKRYLLRNAPDVLSRLFGDKSSQKGLVKLFETFQHHNTNKHFAYVLLSKFLSRLLPEIEEARLKKLKETQLTQRMSASPEQERITPNTTAPVPAGNKVNYRRYVPNR